MLKLDLKIIDWRGIGLVGCKIFAELWWCWRAGRGIRKRAFEQAQYADSPGQHARLKVLAYSSPLNVIFCKGKGAVLFACAIISSMLVRLKPSGSVQNGAILCPQTVIAIIRFLSYGRLRDASTLIPPVCRFCSLPHCCYLDVGVLYID